MGLTDVPGAASRAPALDRIIRRLDRVLIQATKVSSRYTRWRLAIFLTGAAATITLFQQHWYRTGNATLVLFVAVFLLVARYHNRLEDRMQRMRRWRHIKTTHLARLTLDWASIPYHAVPIPEHHPYARDLDIIGPHSLLHLIDTTASSNGRERLAGWLLTQPPTDEQWQARHRLVRELSRLSLFRDRLNLEATQVGEAELNGHRIEAALAPPIGFPLLVPLLLIQAVLAGTTLTLAVASAAAGLPDYWMLSFTAYAAVYVLHSGRVEPIFSRALSLYGELDKLRALFVYLERRSYRPTPAVSRLCAPLIGGTTRPSTALRRLARVTHALSIRAHPLAHLVVNGLGPWDLYFTWRLDRERTAVVQRIGTWLDALSELEAASALATFAGLHPSYRWPIPGKTKDATGESHTELAATALGHPLIPAGRRITNDLTLDGQGRIVLITGSNMSGKSTFLRTVGINVCLAQAGAPVCAERFHWTWVRIGCCIRVDDSLEAGLSYFYAEVKRLKRLLDAAQERKEAPVLFLIDEIFKGTNNRERLAGSRAYIDALAKSHGFGLVTTHDLELADLEQSIPSLTNAHFQETVQAHQLEFDYRLRPGPCPTTNALRIMALEGLPVDGPARDRRPVGRQPNTTIRPGAPE